MAQAQSAQSATPAQPPERQRITLDEYMRLLDNGRYEVINGELITLSPQMLQSSRIAHDLFESLLGVVREKKLGRLFIETVFAFDIADKTNWVDGSFVPDLSLVSQSNYEKQQREYGEKGPFYVVPELAVEVVSETDSFTQVNEKLRLYLGYGVNLIWVIDPKRRVAHVYTPDQPDGHVLPEDATLDGGKVIPGWSISIKTLLDAKPD